MSIRSKCCVSLAGVLILMLFSGCLVQRTVMDGDVVVERKYVVKGPLPGTATGF
jgi:hypothetical protein